MMSNGLGHQYALDAHGRWVDARKTEYEKYNTFFCDCPDRHPMKLVKPSGSLGKRRFCDYFSHKVKRLKSHDDHHADPLPTCASGGESELHRRAKHVLREMVGKYTFATFRCLKCWAEVDEDTEGCSVSIEVRSGDGRWRYDCLLTREDVPVAALEVVHTHLVGEEKATAVRASGLKIAEFRAQDVMDMAEDKKEVVTHLRNLQIREGICHTCLLKRSIRWMTDCYNDERIELVRQGVAEFGHYMSVDRRRRRRERLDTLGRISDELDVVKRCKLLLALGLRSGVKLRIPDVGSIACGKTEEWEHGLLASGFDPLLPTRQVCIVILQDGVDVRSLGLRWNYNSIERRFYFFTNRETILRKLSTVMEEGQSLFLLDCRPVKQFQRHMGVLPVPKRRTRGTCDSWYGRVFAEQW
jgi:hypothetical protein